MAETYLTWPDLCRSHLSPFASLGSISLSRLTTRSLWGDTLHMQAGATALSARY